MNIEFTVLQTPNNIFSKLGLIKEDHTVDLDDYCKVYHQEITNPDDLAELGFIPLAILESAFIILNMHRPKDYKARSLSIGDVIKLGNTYWLLSYDGWNKAHIKGDDDYKS